MRFLSGSSLVLVLLLAGCGSSASPAKPTPTRVPQIATKSYTDPVLHFSFRYPAGWQVQPGRNQTDANGRLSYIVPIYPPHHLIDVEVKALPGHVTIPQFSEGRSVPDPAGGPDTLHYFHVTLNGVKGMRIERWTTGNTVDEIDSIVNSSRRTFDVRTITGTPPFKADLLAGYRAIAASFQVPFS